MGMQENEQLVKDFMMEHQPRYLSGDVVMFDHTLAEPLRGQQPVSQMLDMLYHTAFPGAHAEVQRVHACGSTVVVEFIFHGVNDGNLMGNPATHREVRVPMCSVYDVNDGSIQQIHLYYDSAQFSRQLGLGPAALIS